MSYVSTSKVLAIYAGATSLAFVESSGFVMDSPLLLSAPIIVLAVSTVLTTISADIKGVTVLSFLVSSASRFVQSSSSSCNPVAILLQIVANELYYLSFRHLTDNWSKPITLLCGLVSIFSFFHLFHDLIVAIPYLVVSTFILLLTHAQMTASAASCLQTESHGDFGSTQASSIRLLGCVLSWSSTFLFLHNAFTAHTPLLHTVSHLLSFASCGCLFFSNELAF